MKEYIGDGIYADIQNNMMILTTENGVTVQNTIIVDEERWRQLVRYVEQNWRD